MEDPRWRSTNAICQYGTEYFEFDDYEMNEILKVKLADPIWIYFKPGN